MEEPGADAVGLGDGVRDVGVSLADNSAEMDPESGEFDLTADNSGAESAEQRVGPSKQGLPVLLLLTIGSWGDVQPFIALALSLLFRGKYRPILATHAAHGAAVTSHGIEFRPISGEPHKLMQLLSKGLLHLPSSVPPLTTFLSDLFTTSYQTAVHLNPSAIIASPALLSSPHLADALDIPLFHCFFMPWHRTSVVPHPFLVTGRDLGGTWNKASWIAAEEGLQFGSRALVSSFRRSVGLPTISEWARLSGGRKRAGWRYKTDGIPTIYGWSRGILEKPREWGDEIAVW
jgi:sterol 3beta-glucosyltransferase